ncbi:MAG: type II toxin-antitoxin system RelE/ParE family toxin [Polyangiales bacterium]
MHRRRWRFYETASGAKPVQAFLDNLTATEAAEVVAAMKEIAREGLRFARHLRGDIWEVRVEAERKAFRVLFSPEGRAQQVLLALDAFTKKTQKTPARMIELAERRLSDWRSRGRGA